MTPNAAELAYMWMMSQGSHLPVSADAVKATLRNEIADSHGWEAEDVQDAFEELGLEVRRIAKPRTPLTQWTCRALVNAEGRNSRRLIS